MSVTMPPVKALAEDQVHYLNVLGPKGLSAFNLRSLCERSCEAIKNVSGCRTLSHLINLEVVASCSDSCDWEKNDSFFTLAAWLSLKEICKNLKTAASDPTFFQFFFCTYASRNRVDFTSAMLNYSISKIAHNLFLYPYSKIFIWNWTLKCKFTWKMENEFTSVLLFISITITLTRVTSQKYHQMTLFCIS